MDSATIRRKFLEFFESKGHQIVPSAPLVLKNDPSLLFTNSGMVQFKDFFLGNSISKYKRIADTQKCLRVSGKHNDLEDVGLDTYHHTMFEMLGNWSFGDYFKKDAISWAWELLTEVYKLPKDRLYVSVYGGDQDDNQPIDQEAYDLWKNFVSEDRIILGNKKDNFWEMADVGPCGPCSEIHVDLRSEDQIKIRPGKDLVNNDHPEVVEIWNLVFMEFERSWRPEKGGAAELTKFDLSPNREDKKAREKLRSELTILKALPAKHVDTGMGFERLCMAIQAKTSNYDTDVFRPLMDFIALHANYKYGSDSQKDVAVRVMADHIRAVSFAIADGQLPSNSGAGYVIRRILRRAIFYAYAHLSFKTPFIHRLVPHLAFQLRDVFPELHSQLDYVTKVVHEEEISFLRTLADGLTRLDTWIEDTENFAKNFPAAAGLPGEGQPRLNGAKVFILSDTYGLPKDLTYLILKQRKIETYLYPNWEHQFQIEYEREMVKQKTRSKAAAVKETGDWVLVSEDAKSEFIGYDNLTSTSRIIKFRKVKQKNKELFQLVLDKTPFYAESGGQVGDTGVIESANEKIYIVDTKKENDLIIHLTEALPEKLEGEFYASVNESKRRLTMSNHSATHLLHAALRQVLGKHVEQKGSLVNEKILRFDFSHFAPMTDGELAKVESIVNEKVRENIPLNEQRNVPIEKAKSLGAMALFGEKYGEFVRVITFDPKFSVELCGGTHIPATGNIGMFKIISESSVAAGVRRIEAVTAEGAQEFVNGSLAVLDELKTLMKNPKDPSAFLQTLIEEKHSLEKKLEAFNQQLSNQIKDQLALKAIKSNGHTLIVEKVSLPNADALKNIAYGLRNQFDDLLMVLAAEIDSKPQVAVMIGEKLAASKKFHAGNMVKELAKEIDGGGGGQPFYATAGGKNLNGLDAVLVKAKQLID